MLFSNKEDERAANERAINLPVLVLIGADKICRINQSTDIAIGVLTMAEKIAT